MNAFKKNNFTPILIIVLIILNLVSLYFLALRPMHAERLGLPRREKQQKEKSIVFLKKVLKLSAPQVKEFRKLKKEHREQTKKMLDNMRMLRNTMFENINNENFDIVSITDSIAFNQKKVELSVYNHFRTLRSVCDDNQKLKFDKITHKIIREIMPPPLDGYKRGRRN